MPSNMPDARAINEALRRAREMQSRSAPQREPEPTPPPAPSEPEPMPDPTPQKANEPSIQPPQPARKSTSPLDFLMQDKERTLILALLILLSAEGNNTELLFALMYLLI